MNLVLNIECLFWLFFQMTLKSDLKEVKSFKVISFELRLPYNTWPQLKNITITNIQKLTLNSSFDALSKWHDLDIKRIEKPQKFKKEFMIELTSFISTGRNIFKASSPWTWGSNQDTKNQNKHSKFNTKVVIWRLVEMAWSGNKDRKPKKSKEFVIELTSFISTGRNTFKTWPRLKNITITNIQHLTPCRKDMIRT